MENTSRQPLAAKFRVLGAPAASIGSGKLSIALDVAHELISAASSSSQPRAQDPPLAVLAVYCRTLIEWVISSILKLKHSTAKAGVSASASANCSQKGGSMDTSAAAAAAAAAAAKLHDTNADPIIQALSLWRLLRLLLESSSAGPMATALAGVSVPGSLLPAAAKWLRLMAAAAGDRRETTAVQKSAPAAAAAATAVALPHAQQFCQAVRSCLRMLLPPAAGGTGDRGPAAAGGLLRPSLEQCLTLLTALLEVQPTPGCTDPASSATAAAGTRALTSGAAGVCSAAVSEGKRKHKKESGRADAIVSSAPGAGAAGAAAVDGAGTAGTLPSSSLLSYTHAASSYADWARLCATVMHATHGSVQSHPAPKKVWQAFVPGLVLQLLRIAQPQDPLEGTLQLVLGAQAAAMAANAAAGVGATGAPPAAGAAAAATAELSRAAQQLLVAVLFNEAHVGGLAELFSSLVYGELEVTGDADTDTPAATGADVDAAGAGADDDDAGDGGGAEPGPARRPRANGGTAAAAADAPREGAGGAGRATSSGGDADGSEGRKGARLPLSVFAEATGRSYHGQLLQVFAAAMDSSNKSGADAAAMIAGLPWFLQGFSRAAGKLRRTLAADAAAAAAATGGGGSSQASKRRQAVGAEDEEEGAEGGKEAGAVPSSYKGMAAAEFNCMAALSYMLLQPPPPPVAAAAAVRDAVNAGGDDAGGRPAKKRKLAAAAAAAAAAASPAATASGGGGGSSGGGGGGAGRCLALAGLLAAGRVVGAYQPTRDLTGAHGAVLATIADALMAAPPTGPQPTATPTAAAGPASPTKGSKARRKAAGKDMMAAAAAAGAASGDVEAAGTAPYGSLGALSSSLALCAVLDLDHRVLTPHLERLWSLLWATAFGAPSPPPTAPAAAAGGDLPGAAPPLDAATKASAVGAGGGGGNGAMAAAAAVLQRTVRAFADLRQLQTLLESMGSAMRALCGLAAAVAGTGADDGGGSGQAGGRVASEAAVGRAAAALLVRPEVLGALQQAVSGAPSGQLPSLVGWVALDLRAWAAAGVDAYGGQPAAVMAAADLLLAAGALYDALLTALRLDLATAMPVGQSLQGLLAAVASPLLHGVRSYCEARAAASAAAAAVGYSDGPDGAADDGGGGGGCSGTGALLSYRTARLALLLRMYGAVVRTNSICSGLHPEIPPLPDHEIAPRGEGQRDGGSALGGRKAHGGYLAAAILYGTSGDGGGRGGGADAAADRHKALGRLRKALIRAGCSRYADRPLPALAQLAQLPRLAACALLASPGPAAAGTAEGTPLWSRRAFSDWPAVELSRAAHRCLCHRAQTLHERILRRRHKCPLYGRPPANAGVASGGGGESAQAQDSSAAAGVAVAAAAADQQAAAAGKEQGEEEEEEELRLVVQLILSPFSPTAAAAAASEAIARVDPRPGAGSAAAPGTRATMAAPAAAAAAAAAAGAAWGDVMGLMGCLGPWADQQALAEVLQLALRATCAQAPGGGVVANCTAGPDGLHGRAVSGDSEWRLLRAFRPHSTTCLQLDEFQGLPGVRQALPYSWMAEAAEALRELAAGVRQVAAATASAATAMAAASADGGGAECRPAKKAKRDRRSEPPGAGRAAGRADADATDAVAAADSRLAALLDILSADLGRDGAGGGRGVSGESKGTVSKALRRLLAEQAEALRHVHSSRLSSRHVGEGADPWVSGGGNGDDGGCRVGPLGDGAAGTTAATAAAAGRVRSLLAVLYGDLHLDLLSRKARKALLRRVAAAAGALTDMLLLLLPRLLLQPSREPSMASVTRPEVLSRRRAVLVAWEVSAAAVACLQAWQRLAAVGLYDNGGREMGDGGAGAGRRHSLGDAAADPWVVWLLPASRLLVDLAAVLDCSPVSPYRSAVQDARGRGASCSSLLSVDVVLASGRLLGALLPSRPGEDGQHAVAGTIASHLSLATDLLTQAKARSATLQRQGDQNPIPKGSTARHPRTAADGASTATAAAGAATAAAAEVALLCRLAVAAVSSAIEVASTEEGRDCAVLMSVSALAAQVRALLTSAVGTAVAETEAVAAKADLCAVHLLRALLCLVAIQGQALQRDVKAAATAPATAAQANGGSGSHKLQHRHGLRPGAHAPADVPDRRAVLGLLQQASFWVAAERRLAADVSRGCSSDASSSSSSSGAWRSGAGADTAAIATEPLEHCLALVYGISVWLPYMRHSCNGTAAEHHGGEACEPGGTGREGAVLPDSDAAHAMVVAVQQALMLCTAASERCCYSRTTNMWGVLLADLEPTGAGCASRRLCLESFRHTLAHSNRGQLAALLRGLVHPLTHGSADAGQPPAALLPPLHCLLTCLESLSSPRAIKLLAAQGALLTTVLTELLGALAARAGVAAADAATSGGEDAAADADAISFYGLGGGGGGGGGRAALEAALCCALRCLQSVLAREQTFRLGGPPLAGVLSAVVTLASCQLLRPQPLLLTVQYDRADKVGATDGTADGADGGGRGCSGGGGVGGSAPTGSVAVAAPRRRAGRPHRGAAATSDLYFLHASCSGLVAAVVRHHEDAVRHCAALVVNAARALLLRLAGWASELRSAQQQLLLVHHQQQSHQHRRAAAAARAVAAATDGITRCAGALARVYEAVSEHPKTLGKYAVHLLADYIVHVATPLPSLSLILYDSSSDPWVLMGSQELTGQAACLAGPGLAAEYGNSDGGTSTGAPDAAADRCAYDTYGGGLLGSEGGGGGASGGGVAGAGPVGATLLPPAAHHALRQGAYSLMSCLGQHQLQHLHMALGLPGAGEAAAAAAAVAAGASGLGAARRAALAELRKEYDTSYKYTGKV